MDNALNLQKFLPYRCNNLGEKISLSLSKIYTDEFGISVAEWRILVTLATNSQMRATEIARSTNMDKVRVSRAVASLLGKQLINKRACDLDNRADLLSLSAAGEQLYHRILPQALAWEQALVAPLSDREQKTLFRIIAKLEHRLLELTEIAL